MRLAWFGRFHLAPPGRLEVAPPAQSETGMDCAPDQPLPPSWPSVNPPIGGAKSDRPSGAISNRQSHPVLGLGNDQQLSVLTDLGPFSSSPARVEFRRPRRVSAQVTALPVSSNMAGSTSSPGLDENEVQDAVSPNEARAGQRVTCSRKWTYLDETGQKGRNNHEMWARTSSNRQSQTTRRGKK
jgi:hypothetical protein